VKGIPMGASSIPISTFQESTRNQIKELKRKGDRITIEENGVPVAALVSMLDAEALDRLEQQRKQAWAALNAIRSSVGHIPEEELMNEALKAQREARADMDRERAAAIDAIRSSRNGPAGGPTGA
jgi:hypothetical protein